MNTNKAYFRTNIDFVHHNFSESENLSINFDDYPLGSMPREANSLRNILLIQVANALSPSAFACSSNCWRNSSESRSWYCGDLFSFNGVDTVFTSMYIDLYGNYHNKKTLKKQTPKYAGTFLSVLITHLLKRSKSMTDYNSTPYTAIGASKIRLRNEIHLLSNKDENLSSVGKLLKAALLGYYALAVAKSAAERGNSNISQTANSSTPFNRAFFVCSIRTPKENALSILLSMVGRNGQRLIVGCIPFEAVFHPVMLYRHAWKLAVVPKSFQTELSPMIYLFKAVSRLDLRKTQKPFTSFPHYTIRIQAESLEQAQARISRLFAVLSAYTMAEGVQYV